MVATEGDEVLPCGVRANFFNSDSVAVAIKRVVGCVSTPLGSRPTIQPSPFGLRVRQRQLTAAQFATPRDDRDLLAIAAEIAPARLPALLFSAAATSLVLEFAPFPLRDSFPRVGEPQQPLNPVFRSHYRAFCLDHRQQLAELRAQHRYQMNDVGRCANLLPALAPAIEEDREMTLIDIGIGAGLALHLDRYRYTFHGPGDRVRP